MKHESKTRMPAQRPKHRNADATAKAETPNKTAPHREGANLNTSAKPPQPTRLRSKNQKPKPKPKPKKPGSQGPQLHVSGIAAIVSRMALSKFPFLSLQAGKLLRSLALARLPR
jgi:hypothetical protein